MGELMYTKSQSSQLDNASAFGLYMQKVLYHSNLPCTVSGLPPPCMANISKEIKASHLDPSPYKEHSGLAAPRAPDLEH